jgi:hypothetical protein
METSIYEAFTQRFASHCENDDRVVAAFVGGSRGAGTADEYADLDLYLILYDDAYEAFFAERNAFAAVLGNVVFLEDFNDFGFDMLLFIYADGVEGELVLARQSTIDQSANGSFRTLVDRAGVLPTPAFPPIPTPDDAEQREQLRWLLHWFWRDVSQLTRCLRRNLMWSAYSHLNMMRETCVRLVRLKHDWTAPLEGMYKIEGAADLGDLASLQHTFCTVERAAIIEATHHLIALYERIAPPLAAAHGVAYPKQLRDVVGECFEVAVADSMP